MTSDDKLSRRSALAKIAGLATVGYFAPTMAVMASGHSDASEASEPSEPSEASEASVSSASSLASEPSLSEASDWSAPSIASTGNPTVDQAAQACADSSTSQAAFEECLSTAGLQLAN